MTTPPITASVGEPQIDRPTLYGVLIHSGHRGDWYLTGPYTKKPNEHAMSPGSVLVTIPGSNTTPAPASGDKCVWCGSLVSINHSNPRHSPVFFCHPDKTGVVRAHCEKCVIERVFAPRPEDRAEPATTSPTATRDFGQGGEKCKRCNGTGKYWWNHPNDGPQEVACECVPQPTPSVGSGEEVAWLIERGQPEGQHPPCWLKCNGSQDGYEWVYDANDATKYPTKNAANSALVARSGIANVHSRWAHVTEHVFISQPPPTPDLRAVATTLFKALDEYLDVLDNVPEEASTSEIRYARSLARTALRPGPATRAQENGT